MNYTSTYKKFDQLKSQQLEKYSILYSPQWGVSYYTEEPTFFTPDVTVREAIGVITSYWPCRLQRHVAYLRDHDSVEDKDILPSLRRYSLLHQRSLGGFIIRKCGAAYYHPHGSLICLPDSGQYGTYIPEDPSQLRRTLAEQGYFDPAELSRNAGHPSCVIGSYIGLCRASGHDPWAPSKATLQQRTNKLLESGGNQGRKASGAFHIDFSGATHTATQLAFLCLSRGVCIGAIKPPPGAWGKCNGGAPVLFGKPTAPFLGIVMFVGNHCYYKPAPFTVVGDFHNNENFSGPMKTMTERTTYCDQKLTNCPTPPECSGLIALASDGHRYTDHTKADTMARVYGTSASLVHPPFNTSPRVIDIRPKLVPDQDQAAGGASNSDGASDDQPPNVSTAPDMPIDTAAVERELELQPDVGAPPSVGLPPAPSSDEEDDEINVIAPAGDSYLAGLTARDQPAPSADSTSEDGEVMGQFRPRGNAVREEEVSGHRSRMSELAQGAVDHMSELLQRITTALTTMPGCRTVVDAALVAGPLSAIALAIYNLVDCAISGSASWHKIAISVAALLAGVTSAIVHYGIRVMRNHPTTVSARSLLFRVIEVYLTGDVSAAAAWVELPMKLAAIAIAAIGSCILGRSFNGSMTAIVTGSRVADVGVSITSMVAKLLNIDVDGTHEIDSHCLHNIDQIDKYLQMPIAEWVGEELVHIKNLSGHCSQFATTLKRGVSTEATTLFAKKLGELDKRLADVISDLSSRRPRPAPACYYLWSTQGGLGKTNLATYLPRVLATRVKGFNNKVFTNFSESKHCCAYHGEHTFFMDEVGAQANATFEGAHPYNILNGLVGCAAYPLPAANIEAKNQIPRPLLVLMASNNPYALTASPLTNEAKDAQRTRIVEVEIVDDNFDPAAGRTNQAHRRADFSHLSFRVTEQPGAGQVVMGIDQFVDHIAANVTNNVRLFKEREQAQIANRGIMMINGVEADVSAAAADRKFCYWIAGKPGTRKSTDTLNFVKSVARNLGWGYRAFTGNEQPTNADLNPRTRTFVVLDDLLEMNNGGENRGMDIYNTANENVIFVVVSNYGPRISARHTFTWYRACYTPRDCELPGFARRFGFIETNEAEVIVKTDKAFYFLRDGESVTAFNFVARLSRYVTGSDYVKILPSIPDDIPFVAADADIWIDVADFGSTKECLAHLKNACSPRAYGWLMHELVTRSVENTDLAETIAAVFNRVCSKVSNAKIYIRIAEHLYYLYGREAFVGVKERGGAFILKPSGFYYRDVRDGEIGPITTEQVTAAYLYTGGEFPDQDPTVFYALLRLRNEGTDLWYTMLRRHPVGLKAHYARISERLHHQWNHVMSASDKAETIAGLLAAGAVMASVIAGAYYLWCSKKAASHKCLKGLDMSVVPEPQAECLYCDEGVSHLCPALDPNRTVAAARGGNRGRNKFGMRVTKAGVGAHRREYTCSEQEARNEENARFEREFDEQMERMFGDEGGVRAQAALFDAMHAMEANGMVRQRGSIRGVYQGIPIRGNWSWNGGNLDRDFQIDDDYNSGDESAALGPSRGFENNVVTVENEATGNEAYGMLMDDSTLRVGTHMFHGSPKGRLIVDGGRCYAKAVYECSGTDVTYCKLFNERSKPYKYTGVRSIVNKLVCAADLGAINKVTIVVAGDNTKIVTDWVYERTMARPVLSKDQRILSKAATVVLGSADTHGLVRGKCGSQLLWENGTDIRYLGMFACIRAGGQYVFTVATVEEWNDYCASVNESASGSQTVGTKYYERADYLLPEGWKQEAYMPFQVARNCTVDETDVPKFEPVGPGLEFVKHYKPNKTPIDAICSKVPVYGHAFAEVFGNLKSPALSLEEIESGYADQIQPDKNGNKRAYNIRLWKANANVPINAADSTEHRLRVLRAEKLGLHYAEITGMQAIAPLSKADAIWGNGTYIEPLKKNTSVGATFHSMFAGLVDKGSIFHRTERDKYVGVAGTFTERWIDDQWEMWKEGKLMLFPSSLATKPECLPNAKIWKKRLINVVDPVTVVNQRRLLMPVQKLFGQMGSRSPFQIAMDPLRDYSAVAETMHAFPYKADFDISSFDLSTRADMISAGAAFFGGVYRASATLRRMLESCLRGVAFAPFLLEQMLIKKQGGIPSGMCGTSLFDSAVVHLMVYEYTSVVVGGAISPADFLEHVRCIHGGDDCVLAWSEWLNDLGFSSLGFCNFCRDEYGIEVTPPNKVEGAVQEQDLRGVDELSFCSRQFTVIPGMTYISGKLKAEAMSSALCWTTPEGLADVNKTIEELQPEFACWPDEYYHRYCGVVHRLNLPIRMRGLAAIRAELRDQIVESRSAQKLNLEKERLVLTIEPTKVKPSKVMATSKLDDNTVARRFREALMGAQKPNCIIGSQAWNDMTKAYPICGPKQSMTYKGVVITYPQDWSPGLFSDCYAAIAFQEVAPWAKLASGLQVSGCTKEDRKALWRKSMGHAVMTLACDDSSELRDLYKERVVVPDTSACSPARGGLNAEARENLDRALLAHDQALKKVTELEKLLVNTQETARQNIAIVEAKLAQARRVLQCTINGRNAAHATVDLINNLNDMSCSAPSAGSSAGEPPTVTDSASSATAATGGGAVTGVTENPMPAQAVATTDVVMPIMGMAQPTPMQQITGGMTGVEIAPTAYAHNVLTLASVPIYKKIIPVSTSISEGTVLMDEHITPWNAEIMNPFAYEWAKLHARFNGTMILNFQFITATTVIGAIKAYMVPAVLQKHVKVNQTWLDATATQLELTLNSAGVATLELKPTLGIDMKTGIYRDQGPFGRLVVIASSNVRNAYVNTTQLDLKVSASLGAGSYFDVPASMMGFAPAADMQFLNLDITNPRRIVIDGDYTGIVDYSAVQPANIYAYHSQPSTNHQPTQGMIIGASHAGYCFGDSPLGEVAGTAAHGAAEYFYTAGVATGVSCVSGTSVLSAIGEGMFAKSKAIWDANDAAGRYIEWGLTTGGYLAGFGDPRCRVDTTTSVITPNSTSKLLRIIPRGRIAVDPDYEAKTEGYTCYYYGANWTLTGPDISNGSVRSAMLFSGSYFFMNDTYAFICSSSATTGSVLTNSFRRVLMPSLNANIPIVAAGLRGNTMPAHAADTSDNIAVSALRAINGSLVTKLVSTSGQFIAEIVRNRYGMFTRIPDSHRYSTCTSQLEGLKQEHRFEGTLWPITEPAPEANFASRVAASGASYATGGKLKTFTPRSTELDYIAELAESMEDQSAAAAAAPIAAAALGGGSAGNFGKGLLDIIFSPMKAKLERDNIGFAASQERQNIMATGEMSKQLIAQKGLMDQRLAGLNVARSVTRAGGLIPEPGASIGS